jgi:predicted metal-dependent hydrolase
VNIANHRIDEDARLQIKYLYEYWIIRMANPILKTNVEIYSQKLGVDAPDILIKNNLKSRWASLTRKRSINFNMHLIKAPEDVIDYVVLHELCHLKIKGHSHHYWDLVIDICQTIKKRLIGSVLMVDYLLTVTELYNIL